MRLEHGYGRLGGEGWGLVAVKRSHQVLTFLKAEGGTTREQPVMKQRVRRASAPLVAHAPILWAQHPWHTRWLHSRLYLHRMNRG